jgi:ABC-type transport system substrate-binding protein
MFVGLSGSIDFDPTGSYSTATVNPSCCNFGFYDNPTMDDLISQYTAEPDAAARVPLAKQIQAIAADELPYIPIVNTAGLWAYDTGLTYDGAAFGTNDLFMLATLNYGMSWAKISHPTVSDFVYAHTYDLKEYVPFVQQSYAAAAYMNPILPGLFERDVTDPNYAWAPALAASMPTSTDGKTFVVDINPLAKFSNGDAVTAADVVNTYHMHMWENASSALGGSITPYISTPEQITAVDTDTVQFVFDAPYFGAYGVMALGIMPMDVIGTPGAPAAADYAFNDDPMTYAIGAGPYKYKVIEEAESNVQLEAVPDWWGGDVGFDTISFNKFAATAIVSAAQGGEAQLVDNNANFEEAEFEGVSGWATETVVDFGTQFLSVNMKHPVFGTGVETPLGKQDPSKAADAAKYLRQAISHLIPRQSIIDEILKGRGTVGTTLWPDVAAGYDTSLAPYDYSVSKAIELVKKAGYDVTFPTTSDDGGLPGFTVLSVGFAAFFSAFVMTYKRRNY